MLAAPLVGRVAPVRTEPDATILHLWRRLDAALRRRERAIARRARPVRSGSRLPSAFGEPLLYAAEPSEAAEDAAARVTRRATKALLSARSLTVAAIRLKLTIIVVMHAPGADDRDTSPWREFRGGVENPKQNGMPVPSGYTQVEPV